jgi:hypothetical protein
MKPITPENFEFIKANLDKNWYWFSISKNAGIIWEIIQTNPNLPWDWDGVSQNPNITPDIVAANPDKSWNWFWLVLPDGLDDIFFCK